jgi:hypothetical protein
MGQQPSARSPGGAAHDGRRHEPAEQRDETKAMKSRALRGGVAAVFAERQAAVAHVRRTLEGWQRAKESDPSLPRDAKPGELAGGGPPPEIPAAWQRPEQQTAARHEQRAEEEPPLERFARKLAARDPAATQEYERLSREERRQLAPSEVEASLALDPRLGAMAVAGAKTSFAAYPRWARVVLDSGRVGAHARALDEENLVPSFLDAPPLRGAVSEADAAALEGFFEVASPRRVFEKVFPELKDAPYDPTILKTKAWAPDEVKRLYRVLRAHLPIAHVQAVAGGFHLGTHERLDGKQDWRELGFAWQHGPHMVLPASSARDGGGVDHGMTGGRMAQPLGAAAEARGPALDHFDTSVLHEVGHAVAGKIGGNEWAEARNHFEKLPMDRWAKALLEDSADRPFRRGLLRRLEPGTMSAADARMFVASRIAGGNWLPPGWTEAQAHQFIRTAYAAQPLVQYWEQVFLRGKDDYFVPETNIRGGKVYAFLSRFNRTFCRYDEKTFRERVSWYSLASPPEWFAEQYAHYYRSGAGLAPDVKARLDSLHEQRLDAPAPAAAGAKQRGGEEGRAAERAAEKTPDVRRMRVPW